MAADRVTQVTSQSWLGRIGNAVKGIIAGVVLFLAAFPLLFWNEGRSVKTYKTLKEGSGIVVSVKSDKVDPANESKLVHMSGRAVTESILVDDVFGVSAKALKLKRVVEMYQWKESSSSQTKKKVGGSTETTTTYTYSKGWDDNVINSGEFKEPEGHENPGAMEFSTNEFVASDVTLGAFTLPEFLVSKINAFSPLSVTTDPPAGIGSSAKRAAGGFYIGSDPAAPQVGDLRVLFKVVQPMDVSLIAQQAGSSFQPYKTKAGGTIEMLDSGIHSAEEMFEKAQQANVLITWLLRLAGFLLMMIGLNLVFKPLSVVADVLPIFGRIVGAGTGIIAFLIAAVLSILTIAIAWIVYRPVLGIILLAASAGLIFVIVKKLAARKAQA